MVDRGQVELTRQSQVVLQREQLGVIGWIGVMRGRPTPMYGSLIVRDLRSGCDVGCAHAVVHLIWRKQLTVVVLEIGFLRELHLQIVDAHLVTIDRRTIGAGISW